MRLEAFIVPTLLRLDQRLVASGLGATPPRPMPWPMFALAKAMTFKCAISGLDAGAVSASSWITQG